VTVLAAAGTTVGQQSPAVQGVAATLTLVAPNGTVVVIADADIPSWVTVTGPYGHTLTAAGPSGHTLSTAGPTGRELATVGPSGHTLTTTGPTGHDLDADGPEGA
jgi:hypothetical protein